MDKPSFLLQTHLHQGKLNANSVVRLQSSDNEEENFVTTETKKMAH